MDQKIQYAQGKKIQDLVNDISKKTKERNSKGYRLTKISVLRNVQGDYLFGACLVYEKVSNLTNFPAKQQIAFALRKEYRNLINDDISSQVKQQNSKGFKLTQCEIVSKVEKVYYGAILVFDKD